MSTSLPLTAALISSIGFAFLALAAVKLETFNKAKLRKLRENSKRLAEELEEASDHLAPASGRSSAGTADVARFDPLLSWLGG